MCGDVSHFRDVLTHEAGKHEVDDWAGQAQVSEAVVDCSVGGALTMASSAHTKSPLKLAVQIRLHRAITSEGLALFKPN